jgi:hypothetical protein
MNKLSQRTLVRMMSALSTVPLVRRFQFLYEQEFPAWFCSHARNYYHFNWERILVALRNIEFLFHFGTGASVIDGRYLNPKEAEEIAEMLIQKLAAMAACLPAYGGLVENSLQLDGYAVDKNRVVLVPLEGPVSAQEEEDALITLLRTSRLPNAATVEKHIKDANDLFVQGKPHASLNESRNMLQALIDGISAETHRNGGHPTVALPGGTAKRIQYLQDVGFLTADERVAFGSAWGALSAGSHPGVPAREEARIGLVLALEFGQLLLLKCANWSKNGYKSFSP